MPARVGTTFAFCGAVGAVAWLSLDSVTGTVLEVDYHASRERWTEVLSSAGRLPAGTLNDRCYRNVLLALYHTGRLADEMFGHAQRPGIDLLVTPPPYRDHGTYYQESRLFLELGQVNHAERCAYEALVTSGDQPAVLEQLATISLVQGRPETARIFLCALAKHAFHRPTARDMLRRLDVAPALASDPRMAEFRRNMVDHDGVLQNPTTPDLLQALLDKNPRNKMAFEWLMAHYLTVGSPGDVVARLWRLKDLGYPAVPRHFQEALVIHAGLSGHAPAISGYSLDPDVLRRAQEFHRLTARAASPESGARAALQAGLGDSYFYFYTYGVSGR